MPTQSLSFVFCNVRPSSPSMSIAATGLTAPTSSGLSRFMLDTYSTGGLPGGGAAAAGDADAGVDVTAVEPASSDEATTAAAALDLVDGRGRPPRYGAFVFGDRIALNVTVDWDTLREDPEIVASALEIVGDDVLPAEGGEVDLKVRAGCVVKFFLVFFF